MGVTNVGALSAFAPHQSLNKDLLKAIYGKDV